MSLSPQFPQINSSSPPLDALHSIYQRFGLIDKELEVRNNINISFYSFIKEAWPTVETKYPFDDGWHIQAIAEHLEALFRREIRSLIINIPPRTGKSTLCSVMFPAWVWATDPTETFLYGSFSMGLSYDLSVRCRRLIQSEWYKARWREKFFLREDQNTKGRFDNNRGGYRIATSVGSGVTGLGAGIKILDDPNNMEEIFSDAKREYTNNWVPQVWSTRGSNPKTDVELRIQQRSHGQDVTGFTLANDEEKQWVHLRLPMEFEKGRACVTVILPSSGGKLWKDPRTKPDELLWPNRTGEFELKKLKAELGGEDKPWGKRNIAGQLQQRPAPSEGGIFKKSWWTWWKKADPPPLKYIIQSWDTALEVGEENCYSCCSTWGIFEDEHRVNNVIFLSLWRGKVEFPELRLMAQRMYNDYRDDGSIMGFVPSGNHVPDIVLIEDKASGSPLIQVLRRAGINAVKFNPTPYGKKEERAKYVSPLIECGRVWVPAKPPDYTILRRFSNTLVEHCAIFPNDKESRDTVDTMTQALIRFQLSGWLSNPSDNPMTDGSVRNERALYYGG